MQFVTDNLMLTLPWSHGCCNLVMSPHIFNKGLVPPGRPQIVYVGPPQIVYVGPPKIVYVAALAL